MTSLHRVLVVEDHEPFRRTICKLLRQRSDLLIVGEAADGLDAVHQAEALRPDVVLLDIGLPTLSGIEAAGRIHARVPDAKLMFVSIESSFEVVEMAFSKGAHGYVYKPRAHRDVLTVLDGILRGGRVVGGGLERIARGDGLASHHHHLLFYSSDAGFVDVFSRFIARTLCGGHVVIVLVTEGHDRSLRRVLHNSHVDLALAIKQGRYVPVNICELLRKVMVNGYPDLARFMDAVGDLVTKAAQRATGQHKVAACGECAPTLWARGHVDAAIQLEHLWDDISQSRDLDILCAYPLAARDDSVPALRRLCAEHTAVEIN